MLYLFNTTIMPNEGIYSCKPASQEKVSNLLERFDAFTSAIGHQGSADAFNALFPDLGVQVNRIPAVMVENDYAICLKMKGRINEGEILTHERMLEVGFDFFIMKRLPDAVLGDCFDLGYGAEVSPENVSAAMADTFGI